MIPRTLLYGFLYGLLFIVIIFLLLFLYFAHKNKEIGRDIASKILECDVTDLAFAKQGVKKKQ